MKYLIFIFVLTALYACDPGYSVYIKNRSAENLILKTIPSIESLYMKQSGYGDTILAHKIKEENSLSIYRIRPFEEFLIFGYIGKPVLSEIPFSYIEIVQAGDTIILDTKKKILESFIREKAKKYIIIRK